MNKEEQKCYKKSINKFKSSTKVIKNKIIKQKKNKINKF